jgi:8-oxo-(d)GTP phosphatase
VPAPRPIILDPQPIHRVVHLVRHAWAVDREDWNDADHLRPLNGEGLKQAHRLPDLFSQRRVDRIRSSPAVRCVQTVEPLGTSLGVEVVQDESLFEGHRIRLPKHDGETVLCAHGDNIPKLLDELRVKWDDCAKGSIWSLSVDEEGRVRQAVYTAV